MEITYQIIRKPIKNMYIQIKSGQVLVKVPKRVSEKQIQTLLKEKQKWIEKQLQKQQTMPQRGIVQLLGVTYPVETHQSQIEKADFDGRKVILYLQENTPEKQDELLKTIYRKQAQKQYIITIQKMMEMTGLAPNTWRIRDIQYAWGSCSSKKNITLSLNLIQKREKVIEYVVLHELCHLKHMNHSKEFWNLVASYMPEYKQYRKELRTFLTEDN